MKGGAREQLQNTLVAVILSGPNGFFWVGTSAPLLVESRFVPLCLSGVKIHALVSEWRRAPGSKEKKVRLTWRHTPVTPVSGH